MSGMLHPEGPEPVQTYWLRRILVILALMILVLISLGLARASSGATRTAAPPPVTGGPTESPSPSTSPTASPTAGAEVSPSAGGLRTTAPEPSSSSSISSNRSSAATVTPPCVRKQLQLTLAGKQMLKLAQPAAFTVTIRNNGDETCLLALAKSDFELKVSSGNKAVWSSRSCSTAVFAIAAKLELDQSLSWAVGWDGRGTVRGCAQLGAPPKRGTYLATAQVTGVKVAKLPITLRAS